MVQRVYNVQKEWLLQPKKTQKMGNMVRGIDHGKYTVCPSVTAHQFKQSSPRAMRLHIEANGSIAVPRRVLPGSRAPHSYPGHSSTQIVVQSCDRVSGYALAVHRDSRCRRRGSAPAPCENDSWGVPPAWS